MNKRKYGNRMIRFDKMFQSVRNRRTVFVQSKRVVDFIFLPRDERDQINKHNYKK